MGLKGHRLWAMGQLDATCRAPPLHFPPRRRLALPQPLRLRRQRAESHALPGGVTRLITWTMLAVINWRF
jgi:hypothetical protein